MGNPELDPLASIYQFVIDNRYKFRIRSNTMPPNTIHERENAQSIKLKINRAIHSIAAEYCVFRFKNCSIHKLEIHMGFFLFAVLRVWAR